MAIGTRPQEARHRRGAEVLRRQARYLALDLELAQMGRQIDGGGEPREFRHVAIEALDGGYPDPAQHAAPIGLGQRQIAHQCSPSQKVL